MNREQFHGRVSALDEQSLHKALWTLYWRGTAAMRQRIEDELDAIEQGTRPRRAAKELEDSAWVNDEVRDFVALARSGAYLAGDRRVSPRERTRWRFTFGRLAADAQRGLRGPDPDLAAAALEQLIDLACELRDYDYFRSEDPVEAARFVVSDTVGLLWATQLDQSGFGPFAERAAAQLIRWESRYGWTRTGFGQLRDKETTLATVLARMLRVPDMWVGFADAYLIALDDTAHGVGSDATRDHSHPRRSSNPQERTAALAEWHRLLLDKLADGEAEDRLDRLAQHPALCGPELQFVQAQLAHRRGDVDAARKSVHRCLETLPGHSSFLKFAIEIEAPLPPRARQLLKERNADAAQTP
jgi:hypothetical protein